MNKPMCCKGCIRKNRPTFKTRDFIALCPFDNGRKMPSDMCFRDGEIVGLHPEPREAELQVEYL